MEQMEEASPSDTQFHKEPMAPAGSPAKPPQAEPHLTKYAEQAKQQQPSPIDVPPEPGVDGNHMDPQPPSPAAAEQPAVVSQPPVPAPEVTPQPFAIDAVQNNSPEASPSTKTSVCKAKSMFEQAPSPANEPERPAAKPKQSFRRQASSPKKEAEAPVKAHGLALAAAKLLPSSAHDQKNTVNVSQLIKAGAFSRSPGKDIIPYAELVRLRLEDGIDATQKENYLLQEEFSKVFGMPREVYDKLPQWKKVQAKKKVNLF